jgi:hypothetical protein
VSLNLISFYLSADSKHKRKEIGTWITSGRLFPQILSIFTNFFIFAESSNSEIEICVGLINYSNLILVCRDADNTVLYYWSYHSPFDLFTAPIFQPVNIKSLRFFGQNCKESIHNDTNAINSWDNPQMKIVVHAVYALRIRINVITQL